MNKLLPCLHQLLVSGPHLNTSFKSTNFFNQSEENLDRGVPPPHSGSARQTLLSQFTTNLKTSDYLWKKGGLFVGRAKSLPESGAFERFFNRVGSCFTNNHHTRLERLARSKHFNLLQKFVTYGLKSLIILAHDVHILKLILSFATRLYKLTCSSLERIYSLV